MTRATKTCRACGSEDHNVRSCLDPRAADRYERAGRPDVAARIRRLIGELEESRALATFDLRALAEARRVR